MNEAYREYIEGHTASTELMTDTIMKMRKERKKRHTITRITAAAACAAIVLAITLLPFMRTYTPSAVLPQPDAPQQMPIALTINDMDQLTSSALTPDAVYEQYDLTKLPGPVWAEEMTRFHDHIGYEYDAFNPTLPERFELTNFSSVYLGNYKDNEPVELYEYAFEYISQDGGRVTIALSGKNEPLRDYLIDDGNAQPTEVGGVQMVIYRYEQLYMTAFDCGGVYYDVETENVTEGELAALLLSLTELG